MNIAKNQKLHLFKNINTELKSAIENSQIKIIIRLFDAGKIDKQFNIDDDVIDEALVSCGNEFYNGHNILFIIKLCGYYGIKIKNISNYENHKVIDHFLKTEYAKDIYMGGELARKYEKELVYNLKNDTASALINCTKEDFQCLGYSHLGQFLTLQYFSQISIVNKSTAKAASVESFLSKNNLTELKSEINYAKLFLAKLYNIRDSYGYNMEQIENEPASFVTTELKNRESNINSKFTKIA